MKVKKLNKLLKKSEADLATGEGELTKKQFSAYKAGFLAALALVVAIAFVPLTQTEVAEAKSSGVTTSVKMLKVGKSTTVKGYSKAKSTKKSVAKVKKTGSKKVKITAKKKGTTTIKLYKNGKLKKKIYLIATKSNSFKYASSTKLLKGNSKTVKASVQKGCTVKYSSSKKSVATVNSKGKIVAKKAGKATVKAKVYYKGKKIKTMSNTVRVADPKLNKSSATVGKGSSITLKASNTQGKITWTSSDTSIATVSYGYASTGSDATCTVKGKKEGTATIKMKNCGKTVTCKVTVGSSSSSSSEKYSYYLDIPSDAIVVNAGTSGCYHTVDKSKLETVVVCNCGEWFYDDGSITTHTKEMVAAGKGDGHFNGYNAQLYTCTKCGAQWVY